MNTVHQSSETGSLSALLLCFCCFVLVDLLSSAVLCCWTTLQFQLDGWGQHRGPGCPSSSLDFMSHVRVHDGALRSVSDELMRRSVQPLSVSQWQDVFSSRFRSICGGLSSAWGHMSQSLSGTINSSSDLSTIMSQGRPSSGKSVWRL